MQMLRSISEADMATRFPTLFRKSLILFAFAATLGGGALVAAPAGTNWLLNFSLTPKGSHVIGNPAAATKLVEYASYTCGHCAHFEATDVPQIKKQFVATGKVSFDKICECPHRLRKLITHNIVAMRTNGFFFIPCPLDRN